MTNSYPITVLNNKLKVVSHRLPMRESVSIGVWLKVGGRYESVRASGISHFIEHLVFKGTPTRNTKQIKEEIEGRGGLLNGFTSEDTTCFLVKIVKQYFPLALEVLTDMVQNPLFASKDVERERTVILEEIKMYMDMPTYYVHDLINKIMWPDHPLGRFVSGDFESVSGIATKDIKNFHKKYYRPFNALVSVCGDISHDEVVAALERNFDRVSRQVTLPYEKVVLRQRKPHVEFYEKQTEQSHVVIGMHALKRTDPDRYGLALLHVILGANMSSRLYEEVREKRGLAYKINTGVNYFEDTGAFTVSAGVENQKVDKTVALIMKELAKVKRTGVRPGELKRAKGYFLSQLFFTLEDTLEHMLWFGDKAMYFDTIPSKEDVKRNVDKITVDDVKRLAERLFKDAHLNLVIIGPLKEKQQARIRKNFMY